MKNIAIIARYLLAVLLLVFGLNKFFEFLPMPEHTGAAADYMETITSTYIFPTLAVLYIGCGIFLIINRAIGLVTVILAPLAYNAIAFHLTLDPGNIAAAAVFGVLLIIVMLDNLPRYKALFI